MRYEVNVPGTHGGEAQIVVHDGRAANEIESILDEALARVGRSARAQLWIRDVAGDDDAAARRHGFEPYRDLWQLRCPLPTEPSGLETRAFTPADVDEFVTVNNRAFHWHPEQGGLTADDVSDRMAEPWFDPGGFRLHHRDGRLAGFCWTKIHADHDPPLGEIHADHDPPLGEIHADHDPPLGEIHADHDPPLGEIHADHDPPLGEIYVIAVDPDFSGQGLGQPMTVAGLEWLAGRGLAVGMLYVESDNHPANVVYRRIGFEHHHTDRAYRRRA